MSSYLGIDSGSSYTKLVLIDASGRIAARHLVPSGVAADRSCREGMDNLLRDAGIAQTDLARVAVTGYNRRRIPFADTVLTEITALACAASCVDPRARLILDVGGQDSKAVALDAGGGVIDFALNSKCAAGTGRFLEVTSASLGVALEDLAALAQKADRPLTLSSTCTVFAESEIVSHRAAGQTTENIVAALHAAVADQFLGLLHQVGLPADGPVLFTGGVARNTAIADILADRLGREIVIPPHPQHIGALGAALYGRRKP